ncbi:diacylglycerol kinase family protein, partial [Ramlibacter sp.]|uniref:diacylglycerol kinase family protein n=1 Tax=Ramlibacter sp. TaxID=1917967 RepID=UPI0025E45B1C
MFVVLNPGSGRHEVQQARGVLAQAFERAGRAHTFVPVDRDAGPAAACRQAARQAKEEGGVLVAAGGDGTVSAAAQA